MKKITLLAALCLTIISCNKSNEEKMFIDFKTAEIQKTLKTTPNELNFKIESIEKVKVIKASDSIQFLKKKLSEIYQATGEEEKLTYDYAIKQVDTLISSVQGLIELRVKGGRSYENYEDIEFRNKWIQKKSELEYWKARYDNYSKNKDKILSTEFKVNYTINNPILKINQNFISQIYSDNDNKKIIKEIKNE